MFLMITFTNLRSRVGRQQHFVLLQLASLSLLCLTLSHQTSGALNSNKLDQQCSDGSLGNGKNYQSYWTMPFVSSGGKDPSGKKYYIGHFFKANWFKASQYCRFHGMHLASIESKQENDALEKYVTDFGLGHEHFWTSGTDQGEEGSFFWFGNGKPITFTNWNAGEPNNFKYENGEEEHCLELWNRDGKGLKWNDTPCSFETYFICEL